MKYVPYVLWLLGIALLAFVAGKAERDNRRADAAIEALRDTLARRSDSVRVVFKAETVTVAAKARKFEALKAKIDTQWLKPDTVPVPVEVVREVVAAADTTIKACQQTIRTCAASLRLADSIHVVDLQLITSARKPRWKQLAGAVLLGGLLAKTLLH